MAKLPKLLAAYHANKAKVEKAAKSPRRAPDINPGTAQIVATVVPPDVPQPPNNHLAAALDECTTVEHCNELLAYAKRNGYAEPVYNERGRLTSGAIIAHIRAKIDGLKRGTHHSQLSTETLHAAAFPEYAAAQSAAVTSRASKKRGGAR